MRWWHGAAVACGGLERVRTRRGTDHDGWDCFGTAWRESLPTSPRWETCADGNVLGWLVVGSSALDRDRWGYYCTGRGLLITIYLLAWALCADIRLRDDNACKHASRCGDVPHLFRWFRLFE